MSTFYHVIQIFNILLMGTALFFCFTHIATKTFKVKEPAIWGFLLIMVGLMESILLQIESPNKSFTNMSLISLGLILIMWKPAIRYLKKETEETNDGK
jgi:hypothetical protein